MSSVVPPGPPPAEVGSSPPGRDPAGSTAVAGATGSPGSTGAIVPPGGDGSASTGGPLLPSVRSIEERRRRLATMKRRATALLAAVTVVFVVITRWGPHTTWAGYVQAAAEAAMVGALADWFAVTALFRHPLGLKIPHTAVVVERKDQFAATLGEFIQESFLTPEAMVGRLRRAELVPRLSRWLREPEHARRVAAEVLDGAVQVSDLVRDEDVNKAIEKLVHERVESITLAPMAGRALELAIRDGRHHQVLEAGLRELDVYLDSHRDELRERLNKRSPWWLPGAAEDRIFERLIEGARTVIAEMLDDPQHSLRRRFDVRLDQLVVDLETSPEYLERGEKLKREVLTHPQVDEWIASFWPDAKARLRLEAENPDGLYQARTAAVVISIGERLRDDPALAAKIDEMAELAVVYLVERFRGEIVEVVTETISRWDATETAERLELLLGPDLQFIRINGTVVGALAGLALHALAQLLT
jgi:uncharacterized membrane-anchored protein YjiN (DUF445 family)